MRQVNVQERNNQRCHIAISEEIWQIAVRNKYQLPYTYIKTWGNTKMSQQKKSGNTTVPTHLLLNFDNARALFKLTLYTLRHMLSIALSI